MKYLHDPLQIEVVRMDSRAKRWLPSGLRAPEYQLLHDLHFEPQGFAPVTVPKGWQCNGTSIPFPFTAFWPRLHPDYFAASVIHDFLYSESNRSRHECDAIFYQALRRQGCGKCVSGLFRGAVFIGGWKSWRKSHARKS